MATLAFVLVISSALYVSCYAALGEERCTWGPSYWCKSQDTAKECGTIEYCIDKVWKSEPPLSQDTSGPLCILCEFVMRELDDLLEKNSTQAEIEAALEKVCSFLPSTIRADCDKFVEEYSKEIIKLLVEGASPTVVCALLKLCLTESTEQWKELTMASKIKN